MDFEGFDYDVFSNSVEEAFKEPAAKLISSKETMLVAGNLLKIKSRITKIAFYLNEFIKKVDDLTPEQMDEMNPDQCRKQGVRPRILDQRGVSCLRGT